MNLKKAISLGVVLCIFLTVKGQEVQRQTNYVSESNIYENNALDLSNQIEIYPNPSIEFVLVSIKNSTLKNATFELHSMIGNTVTVNAKEIERNKFKIDMQEFSSGYYFLVVRDDQSKFKQSYKFLKK